MTRVLPLRPDAGNGGRPPRRLPWGKVPVPVAVRRTAVEGTIGAFQAVLPDGQHHLQAIVWLSPAGWRAQLGVYTNLISPFPPNEPIPASRALTVEEMADAVKLGPPGVQFALPLDGSGVLGDNAVMLVEFFTAVAQAPPVQGGP